MAENDIKSPDALEVKGKAKPGLRIGKKAAFLVIMLFAIAGVVVAINIATRKPAGLDKNAVGAAPDNKKLQPATAVGAELARGVPDGQASSWAKGNMASGTSPAPAGGNTLAPVPGQGGFGPAAGTGAAPLSGPATPGAVADGSTQVPDLNGPAPGVGAGPAGNAPRMAGNGGRPPMSDAEIAAKKLREQREQELARAMQAGTAVEKYQQGNGMSGGAQAQQSPSAQLAALARSVQQGGAGGAMPAGFPAMGNGGPMAGEEPDQNRQAQKQAFLDKAAAANDTPYLSSVRKAPMSPYEIKTGTVIPAVMVDGINSDLPGDIIAQVSENVYDTASGRSLLIPQGSKLYGSYDSSVAFGQKGLLVTWKRLVFPDASTLELKGMGGSDSGGYSGFRDQVDNHYGRIIGFGLMTSLFSAAFQLSQPQQSTTNGQLSSQQTVAAAVGTQMSQLGIEITRKNLRIQPTIEIRPGYRFVVKVNRDIVFPSTYR